MDDKTRRDEWRGEERIEGTRDVNGNREVNSKKDDKRKTEIQHICCASGNINETSRERGRGEWDLHRFPFNHLVPQYDFQPFE